MDSRLLRTLWSVVESTPSHLLTSFDDVSLSHHLLDQLGNYLPLSREQETILSSYISERTPLIRAMADT